MKIGPTSMLRHSRRCSNKLRKSPAHAVHRSKDDPQVFWTTEIYADEAAFTAHSGSETHAAADPIFTELIAQFDLMVCEPLMATGLDR